MYVLGQIQDLKITDNDCNRELKTTYQSTWFVKYMLILSSAPVIGIYPLKNQFRNQVHFEIISPGGNFKVSICNFKQVFTCWEGGIPSYTNSCLVAKVEHFFLLEIYMEFKKFTSIRSDEVNIYANMNQAKMSLLTLHLVKTSQNLPTN